MIVDYRLKYPAIGAVKIRKMLENEGYSELPSASTINEIFKRNGLITPQASEAAKHIIRYEKSSPNEMWQADFKGNFAMKNGVRCYPLNIIDDCSRFNLCCEPLEHESLDIVRPVMVRLFREYGLPFSFLCDNGNPWGTSKSTGFTRFEVWLMELGILTLHGRFMHPQTQGKEERFNGTMTRELLKQREFSDTEDAKNAFDEYRNFYNNKRPHHALGLDVPAARYRPSSKAYPEKIEEWEYPDGYVLQSVRDSGYITYKGQKYFLSEVFGGKRIAIKESHISNQITLHYRQFVIGRIDTEKRVFIFKKAYLAENDPRGEHQK
jgi:transposase InsO family protein